MQSIFAVLTVFALAAVVYAIPSVRKHYHEIVRFDQDDAAIHPPIGHDLVVKAIIRAELGPRKEGRRVLLGWLVLMPAVIAFMLWALAETPNWGG